MSEPENKSSPLEVSTAGQARKISRRSFGRRAASVAAMALSPAALRHCAMSSNLKTRLEQSASASRDQLNSGLMPEAIADVDAKHANIIRKWGTRLSASQREHLRKILVYNEKMLESVRSFPLENGDPPASVLKLVAGVGVPPNGRPGIRGEQNRARQRRAQGTD